MRMYELIEKKREGHVLTEEEIQFFIKGYTRGEIPDYQASALLMAIYFQGMTTEESAYLTMAIVNSGETIDLSMIDGIKVDKHSSGGVGDSVTLILAPLVASCGVKVAKMSGRGLGHTGGTLDKLESFTGFHVEIDNQTFVNLVKEYHLAVIGQSDNLVPADKLLYSLRDVTATVNAIPLIASSIMSKKIASGADAIVLDIKTGAGAFMKSEQDAITLAETMVAIGEQVGRKTTAIISSMDEPLGFAIGNALEVKEAVQTLKGEGPQDLTELVLELASQMLVLAERTDSSIEARKLLENNLYNGAAIQSLKNFIEHQGGSSAEIDDLNLLPQARFTYDITAQESGVIKQITADEIGRAAMLLGAGRATKDDTIDLGVGLVLHQKVGDHVQTGDIICTVHSNEKNPASVLDIVQKNIIIGKHATPSKLIRKMIQHTD
ncbi:MAG TPA: pyrimidine-nucleoside phosphorylase [Pseudogracilibacillus sp.]|nr:pyrimidine-nucleoside phosphorylase [Pseudogracilibacillus sp.]